MTEQSITEFVFMPVNEISIAGRTPIFGVGINDAEYLVNPKSNGRTLTCQYYAIWKHMLERCYDPKYHKIFPTYKACIVCKEWLIFSNFRKWMEAQDWEGKQLDKDILVFGNKEYSPYTCVFVTPQVNALFSKGADNGLPPGVNFEPRNGKYRARCHMNGKSKNLGYYETPSAASEAYVKCKSNHIMEIALKQTNPLRDALVNISQEMAA